MLLSSSRTLRVWLAALTWTLVLHVPRAVHAQEPIQVTLGHTVITGMSQTFGNVSVDFFGGQSLPLLSLSQLSLLNCSRIRLGIPFAHPPVGARRFAPPELMHHIDSSTLDATQFGPACAQLDVSP